MKKETSQQKSIADRLVAALDRDEFVLYSQSIIPLFSKGANSPFQEIFIRFKEEDVNLLPPGSFFPILDEHNLLPHLDRWVVNRLSRWVSGALSIKADWIVPVSNINLSNATLADPDFGGYVHGYVDNSFLSNGALGFEVDCDSAINHTATLRQLLKEVGPFGCSLTLTEFDGSETAFSTLKMFAPEFVKISAPSVNPVKISEINRRCRTFGTKTIVQYVESAESLDRLREMKIDFAQGLHLSPVQVL
jgi:EAL domain-containing protein (putative c-di-GMP-specific phosphodiesterase class I)